MKTCCGQRRVIAVSECDDCPAVTTRIQVEWQPIETAPKDGTVVLLFGTFAGEISGVSDGKEMHIGYWKNGRSDYDGNDWWRLAGGDAYTCWMRPTHWMPLPEKP